MTEFVFSKNARDVVPAPAGVDVDTPANGFWSELPSQLKLKNLGVFTPWALRDGDLAWVDYPEVSSEYDVFHLTTTPEIFDHESPFCALVSRRSLPRTQVDSVLDHTDYVCWGVEALANVKDRSSVPSPLYLIWVRKVGATQTSKKSRTLQWAANQLGSIPALVLRRPVKSRPVRMPYSAVSYASATPMGDVVAPEVDNSQTEQFLQSAVVQAQAPQATQVPQVVTKTTPAKASMLPVAGVFLGALAAGFLIRRAFP
jgi:hypothetical protein